MLYIVATPIGNIKDITLRALDLFHNADIILTEDTRKSGLFLKRLEISPRPQLVSFYEHNEEKRIPEVIEKLKDGKDILLTSRAGVPLVSDPGFKLIRECEKEGIPFTSLPGPSAVLNALVLSGMPTHSFVFLGFLPRRKKKRRERLEKANSTDFTLVFFENPKRLAKTFSDIKEVLGDRMVCVVREMTKKYEEVIKGRVSELCKSDRIQGLKGECTIVVKGKSGL